MTTSLLHLRVIQEPIYVKFGKSTEIATTHIQCITSLSFIQNSHSNRIHDFYEMLVVSVRTFDTLNKLKKVSGYVRMTLDKLPGICADVLRIDEDWRELMAILLCCDIEKAFLQTRIQECERNVLPFHWVKKCNPNRLEKNRFTRLVFRLMQSPFILEATLKVHFNNYLTNYPKGIENISDDMYVDDLTSGGNTVEEVKILKQKCEELFKKGAFNLHK